MLIGTGVAQLAVDCALTYGRTFSINRCFQAMCTAEAVLRSLRIAFGDFARLFYPWNPDD